MRPLHRQPDKENRLHVTWQSRNIPPKLQVWVEARKRYHLSHAHIQMARELGMNPKKFGSLANHKQEPWKAPLPQFIEELYDRSFGRPRPEKVVSIEERAAELAAKKAARRERRDLANEELDDWGEIAGMDSGDSPIPF